LTDDVLGDCVGLDDGEGAFDGHGVSCNEKVLKSIFALRQSPLF
jgi:hypothetical protein